MDRSRITSPRSDRRRFVGGVLASILAHLLILILLMNVEPPPDAVPKREAVRLRILDSAARAAIPAVKKRESVDGQIVDLPRPPIEKVPDEARFLSRWDSQVAREVKARRTASGKGAPVGRPKGARQPDAAPSARETVSAAEALPSPDDARSMPAGSPGAERPGRGMRGLAGLDRLLVPGLSGGRGAARSYSALPAGDPTGGVISSDAVFGVPDEGDQTLVNTRSFKYWDFFQRVKERVREEWRPGDLYQARDPYGKVFGNRDRLTILAVILDTKGAVARMQVARESGVPFLDEEAMRSFREAGPFPNPPAGLADEDGRIAFSFGFLLEVGAGQGKFFWQRPE
jgi:TonB family protein